MLKIMGVIIHNVLDMTLKHIRKKCHFQLVTLVLFLFLIYQLTTFKLDFRKYLGFTFYFYYKIYLKYYK